MVFVVVYEGEAVNGVMLAQSVYGPFADYEAAKDWVNQLPSNAFPLSWDVVPYLGLDLEDVS